MTLLPNQTNCAQDKAAEEHAATPPRQALYAAYQLGYYTHLAGDLAIQGLLLRSGRLFRHSSSALNQAYKHGCELARIQHQACSRTLPTSEWMKSLETAVDVCRESYKNLERHSHGTAGLKALEPLEEFGKHVRSDNVAAELSAVVRDIVHPVVAPVEDAGNRLHLAIDGSLPPDEAIKTAYLLGRKIAEGLFPADFYVAMFEFQIHVSSGGGVEPAKTEGSKPPGLWSRIICLWRKAVTWNRDRVAVPLVKFRFWWARLKSCQVTLPENWWTSLKTLWSVLGVGELLIKNEALGWWP